MKNEAPEMNKGGVGQTIGFKSAEQLSRENPETEPAPRVEAIGATFEKITSKSTLEYKPGAVETIPEQVSTQQLQADCLERLDGQYGD